MVKSSRDGKHCGKRRKYLYTESPPFPIVFSKPIFLIHFDAVCFGVLKYRLINQVCKLGITGSLLESPILNFRQVRVGVFKVRFWNNCFFSSVIFYNRTWFAKTYRNSADFCCTCVTL